MFGSTLNCPPVRNAAVLLIAFTITSQLDSIAAWATPQQATEVPIAKLTDIPKLRTSFDQFNLQLSREYRKANESRRLKLVQQRRQLEIETTRQFIKIAATLDDSALVIKHAGYFWSKSKATARQAVTDFIVSRYQDDLGLVDFLWGIEFSGQPSIATENALRRLIEESTNPSIQGHATWTLIRMLEHTRNLHQPESLVESQTDKAVDPELQACLDKWSVADINKEIEALLIRCRDEWPAVVIRCIDFGDPKRMVLPGYEASLGSSAKGRLISLKLQNAMQAPEISALNVEGLPMTLSQFRGKIVLLQFWNRGGPVSELLKEQRQLALELSDEPFEIVGIFQGANANDATDLAFGFPSFHDGDKNITRAWNSRMLEQAYLIDAEGKIIDQVDVRGLAFKTLLQNELQKMGHDVQLVPRYKRDADK